MLKEDDVVLCTVRKIEGASVFLEIDGDDKIGTMVLSEVAAGRIRNLREYVSPGRKIVCKVLQIQREHVDLSLRRVTAKEKKRVLESYKKEKALASVLKIVGEDSDNVLGKIKERYALADFFDEVKENPALFGEFLGRDKAEKVAEMFGERDVKERRVEKRFKLVSFSGEGVEDIKKILDISGVEMHYLGSGVFSVAVRGKEFKSANLKLNEVLEEIGKRAKSRKAVFEILKEKK